MEIHPDTHILTLFDLDFKKEVTGRRKKDLHGVLLSLRCASALSCMYGRTVGIFSQAIFRLPLVGSGRRTAEEEVARAERTSQRHSETHYLRVIW